jgi:hypothetical protein
MLAASAHQKGKTKSAARPKMLKVIQKTFRCIVLFYPGQALSGDRKQRQFDSIWSRGRAGRRRRVSGTLALGDLGMYRSDACVRSRRACGRRILLFEIPLPD